MAQIQIDLPNDINKKVAIYKINNNLKTKEQAIIKILKELK